MNRRFDIKAVSLCASITLDECHAWFHLYGRRRTVINEKKAKNSKW